MVKKGITLVVILILVSVSVVPISGFRTEQPIISESSGDTLYVGGSGPGNYSTIQEAIDNASDGDTVFVYSGIYNENVIVDKSINLIGENKVTTVIDGNMMRDVVWVTANWINISGFTIRNSGNNSYKDAGIHISSSNNVIKNNIVTDNNYAGIYISYNGLNTITGNKIKNNYDYGLFLIDAYSNDVYDNIIENNTCGISSTPSQIPINRRNIDIGEWENHIYRNKIMNNECGLSLEFYECTGHYVFENSIYKNGYGIFIYCCNCNRIYRNNITENRDGILITGWKFKDIMSYHNQIYLNNIMYNIRGIRVDFGKNNIIYQNNFFCNVKYNAWDDYDNQWDNRSLGNFWDDYTGEDTDNDGIGDIPYNIIPIKNENKDNYPLIDSNGYLESMVKFIVPFDCHLYIRNHRIMPFPITLILGKIRIEARATKPSCIEKAELYINNNLVNESLEFPYKWRWSDIAFFKHKIKIIAYDNENNETIDEISVWRLF